MLLCSEAHAHLWAERQAGRGRALGLIAAVEEGARNWALGRGDCETDYAGSAGAEPE